MQSSDFLYGKINAPYHIALYATAMVIRPTIRYKLYKPGFSTNASDVFRVASKVSTSYKTKKTDFRSFFHFFSMYTHRLML